MNPIPNDTASESLRITTWFPLKGECFNYPLAIAEHRRRYRQRNFHLFKYPSRGYKLREFENSQQNRGAPGRGINSRQSKGPNATGGLFCVRFLAKQKMNKLIAFILEQKDKTTTIIL